LSVTFAYTYWYNATQSDSTPLPARDSNSVAISSPLDNDPNNDNAEPYYDPMTGIEIGAYGQ
jgi:hypothetical protein